MLGEYYREGLLHKPRATREDVQNENEKDAFTAPKCRDEAWDNSPCTKNPGTGSSRLTRRNRKFSMNNVVKQGLEMYEELNLETRCNDEGGSLRGSIALD